MSHSIESRNIARQPAGVPTGGQFAATPLVELDTTLTPAAAEAADPGKAIWEAFEGAEEYESPKYGYYPATITYDEVRQEARAAVPDVDDATFAEAFDELKQLSRWRSAVSCQGSHPEDIVAENPGLLDVVRVHPDDVYEADWRDEVSAADGYYHQVWRDAASDELSSRLIDRVNALVEADRAAAHRAPHAS